MQTPEQQKTDPVNLAWNADGSVKIVWGDAHESVFQLAFLREKCPCATCKGTHGAPTTLIVRQSRGGLPIVASKSAAMQAATTVKRTDPVGGYAIRFTWGDGHDAGLFSFRYLRALCPCPACTAASAA